MELSAATKALAARVPAEICSAVRAAKHVALIGHVVPDADCIASIGSLWLALPELGITPHAVLPAGTVARRLEYLLRHAGMKPATEAEYKQADLVLVVDTAKAPRVNIDGKLESLPGVPVINVDHHATNTQFGTQNWVVGDASSAAELVHSLLLALGCQITPTIATLLYAGIHTDTQGFSLSNTSADSLLVGHALAQCGARIPEVCEAMHRSQSRNEFDLLKLVYSNTRLSEDGRLAWSTVTYEEMQAAGCDAAVIDDQVEIPRSIEGTAVAILFSEGDRGKIRMNFRGDGGVSILELAQQFEGGGHSASAGARLEGTMDEITARVLPAALEFVRNLPPATS